MIYLCILNQSHMKYIIVCLMMFVVFTPMYIFYGLKSIWNWEVDKNIHELNGVVRRRTFFTKRKLFPQKYYPTMY